VDRQRDDCVRKARERGWTILEEYVDNSKSAYSKTAKRPAYDRMVADYAAGKFQFIVVWDLDRLTRQPRQLEDWIDAAEDRGLVLVTATGDTDLSTGNGRSYARMKATMARAEMDQKSFRQKAAAVQRANQGRPPQGRRLVGYDQRGAVIPDEAKMVRAVFKRFDDGESLRGLVVWLREQGYRAQSGETWQVSSVRALLTNPRYAGRVVYQRKTTGQLGNWEPLVSEQFFDGVQSVLQDPRRLHGRHGTDRKFLGSGIYRCGVCTLPLRSHGGSDSKCYRCKRTCLTRRMASIDKYVVTQVCAFLSRRDLANLVLDPQDDRQASLAAQIGQLRRDLREVESDYRARLIDGRMFASTNEQIRAELDIAEAARQQVVGTGLGAILGDTQLTPVEAFLAATLNIQRSVINTLMTVTVNRAPKAVTAFSEESVTIDWNYGEPTSGDTQRS
jgi:site-specific DNA recombinase